MTPTLATLYLGRGHLVISFYIIGISMLNLVPGALFDSAIVPNTRFTMSASVHRRA